jgi:hypothetical protein
LFCTKATAMKKIILFIFIIFPVLINAQPCLCGNGRYVSQIFGKVSLGVNVQYTQNQGQNFDGSVEHERMDIWGPSGDNCSKRPVIIWVHGGGFAQMDKSAVDIVAMCDSFSRRGFVVASIDYRDDYWGPYGAVNDYSQNPTPYDTKEFTRAAYRAMQDAKCAVRFLKANAALYGIDTSFIFMGGTSAGAWTSLMAAYLDKLSEKPQDAYQQSLVANYYARPDLGSIDGGGGWNNVSSRIRGIISCWGALYDTSLIDGPAGPAAILFHENNDPVVNFLYGPPFQGQYPNFNSYWGSYYLNMQMDNTGIDNRFYPINGNQHSLYPYRGLVTVSSGLFLDSIICTPPLTTSEEDGDPVKNTIAVSVFPNPCSGSVNISVNEKAQITLYNLLGERVAYWIVTQPTSSIDVQDLNAGLYLLNIETVKGNVVKRLLKE